MEAYTFTEEEVAMRFDRPSSEWDTDDIQYYTKVICRTFGTDEDSEERRLRSAMTEIRHARIRSESQEYVAGEISRRITEHSAGTLEGRLCAWLGNLAHR